jgi:hypothetical protein
VSASIVTPWTDRVDGDGKPHTAAAELEVTDEDILYMERTDSASVRPAVTLHYRRLNAFIGDYLGRMRRGETLVIDAPRDVCEGELVRLEITFERLAPVVLAAEVVALWAGQAEILVVAGRMTDHVVAPIFVSALGLRHTAALLELA